MIFIKKNKKIKFWLVDMGREFLEENQILKKTNLLKEESIFTYDIIKKEK